MDNKQLKIITAWDENNEIKLLTKDDSGKKIVKTISNIQWYFAIRATDYQGIKNILDKYVDHGVITKLQKFGEYVKVYVNRLSTDERWTYFNLICTFKRCNIPVFESDLSIVKRFMVDHNIGIDDNLKVAYFDIETEDSLSSIEIGRDRILSIATCDQSGNIFFEHGDECTMLKKFIEHIDNYDVFTGWNSKNFDFPYIQARMARYGLEYDWKRTIHIDLMQRMVRLFAYTMHLIDLHGFSLNEVSRCFLNQQKVPFKGKVIELYNSDFETFKKYNINDAQLLKNLDSKLNIISLMAKQCQWTGSFLNKFYVGELLDNYMLRESKKRKMMLSAKPFASEIKQFQAMEIRGGYVRTPITGLHENVRIFDFKSLYPSIIVGWNIGQDSLNEELSRQGEEAFNKFLNGRAVEEINFSEWYTFLKSEKKRLDPNDEYYQTANNNYFARSVNSFIGELVESLLNKRAEIKKEMKTFVPGSVEYNNAVASQSVAKELANSMYGITGDRTSRYFNMRVSESITLQGQFLNKTSAAIAHKLGLTVIYGDTDSIFIHIDSDEDVERLTKEINAKLATFLMSYFRLRNNIVQLEYEKKFSKLIMLDKKKYTGRLVLMNDKTVDMLFSRGTENIKKNTIAITRRSLIELINMIVRDNVDVKTAKKWMQDLKDKVFNGELHPEDLIITTKVSKPTYTYKSKPVHIRLAERLVEEKKILQIVESEKEWGTRLEYIVLSPEEGTDKQEAVLLDEYHSGWDKKYYWDVQIYAPIMRILKCVWPDEDWDSHSIVLFEKMQRKVERENAKIERDKAKIEREKIREQRKLEREKKKKETELRKLSKKQKHDVLQQQLFQ